MSLSSGSARPTSTLADAARPGAYFPQPWALSAVGGLRLDDVLGPGAWLIHRGPKPGATDARLAQAAVCAFDVAAEALAPFAAALSAWLDAAGADAVLVRPDRYVFGAAAPERLLEAYGAAMRPLACEAA